MYPPPSTTIKKFKKKEKKLYTTSHEGNVCDVWLLSVKVAVMLVGCGSTHHHEQMGQQKCPVHTSLGGSTLQGVALLG
jgi:hypothetical protein